MRNVLYLFVLLIIACSGPDKSNESLPIAGNTIKIEGTKFVQAKLSLDGKFLAALDEKRDLHLIELENQKSKIIATNVKEFLFSDGYVLFITERYTPIKSSSLKVYTIKDSVEFDLIDKARILAGLKKSGDKIVVRQNGACRIFNNNFNDWETELPEEYCFVIDGKLFLKDKMNANDVSEFTDSVIWADKRGNSLVYYKKKEGTNLILGENHFQLDHLLKPQFSPSGDFIAGIKEKYDGQKLINSDIIVYLISNDKVNEIDRIENGVAIEWSDDETKVIVVNINGSVEIKEFKRGE